MTKAKEIIFKVLCFLADGIETFAGTFKKALYNETGKKVNGMKLLKKKKGGGGCK